MRKLIGLIVVLCGAVLQGQNQFLCTETLGANGAFTLACVPANTPPPATAPVIATFTADSTTIQPGQSTVLRWTYAPTAPNPTAQNIAPGVGNVAATTRSRTVTPTITTEYLLTAANGTATAVPARVTVTVQAPPVTQLWSAPIDPVILGTCTAAIHDAYTVTPPGAFADGFRYRTWHPMVDPSGCQFGHEHGANPADSNDPRILQSLKDWPIMFGYISRRYKHHPGEPGGHLEPDEGFKVFVEPAGQVNDEGRTNKTPSLSIFHMGTGGPARGSTDLHSNDLRHNAPDVGFVHTQLMNQTSTTITGVCDPRRDAPAKDGLSIGQPCKVNSTYEIWTTLQYVRNAANTDWLYRSFAVPAVFDPLTAFDPKQPTRLIPVTSSEVNALLNFPTNDRSFFRGCDRESYAQVGDAQNAGGPTMVWTDPTGIQVPQSDPNALRQIIPAMNLINHLSGLPDNRAFKMRRSYCGTSAQRLRLSQKN